MKRRFPRLYIYAMTKCVHLLRKFYEHTSNFGKFLISLKWEFGYFQNFQIQILKHINNKKTSKNSANNKTPILNNI
jgi:hypothetical protein